METHMTRKAQGDFPTSAGILFGLGLGGFDGIILHQVLQWHHMVTSAGYPPDTVRNLEINTASAFSTWWKASWTTISWGCTT